MIKTAMDCACWDVPRDGATLADRIAYAESVIACRYTDLADAAIFQRLLRRLREQQREQEVRT